MKLQSSFLLLVGSLFFLSLVLPLSVRANDDPNFATCSCFSTDERCAPYIARKCVNSGGSEMGATSPDQARLDKAFGLCSKALDKAKECAKTEKQAQADCDEKNDSGLSEVADGGSKLALMFGQQTSGSIAAACSKMAALTVTANAAVYAFGKKCSGSQSTCSSTCKEAKQEVEKNCEMFNNPGESFASFGSFSPQVREQAYRLSDQSRQEFESIESNIESCKQLSGKKKEVEMAMGNLLNTGKNAMQCASMAGGSALPGLGTLDALADCSSPGMASNPVCICVKNPTDPSCTGLNMKGGSGDFASSGGGSSLGDSRTGADGAGGASGLDLGSDGGLASLLGIEQGKRGDGSSEDVGGNKGGAGAPGGGGGGGNGRAPAEQGGAQGKPASADINAGFYGGANNFRPGGGGGSGYAGAPGGAPGGPSQPDLSQFLPNGKLDPRKARGLAGMAGPDGITGPHSNIWQKVNNRYNVVKPSLLP